MELLERFTHGDIEAFETLFREYQHDVYSWILRMVRDPSSAEDLTIETFLRIHRSRARFDPSRSFGAWARRIAANVATEHLKSKRRLSFSGLWNPPAPAAPDPALRNEIREKTRSAVMALAPDFRVAVTLALIEERPYQEIAETLGVSVGTVKSRVFRGTRILRKKLQRWGITP